MTPWTLPVLLIALAAIALRRAPPRGGPTRFAFAAVLGAAALAHTGIAVEEARLASRWESIARAELDARASRIAAFLRDRGSIALAAIRAIGADPDTRALLSGEPALAQAARRPVFLDLLERFPRGGVSGATVYDAQGRPRAWAGWTPTATMSLAREPSTSSEVVEIRQGNIFTILEATHPIADDAGEILGYAVYQEPLRVEFPLHNRFLRIEDRLSKLEGGSGARADVALEVALARGNAIGAITAGAAKFDLRGETASSARALLAPDGSPAGRVSLSGLSRAGLAEERLAVARRAAAMLLLLAAGALGSKVWRRARALPLVRAAAAVAARFALLLAPWPSGLDPLRIFDPSWFASIRYAGLLRSPGDLLLTVAAALVAGRELRRAVRDHAGAIEAFARRAWPLAIPAGGFAALLVGSLVGLHWSRVTDVARNSNVSLYGGLDPFTSAPVAVLEAGLLALGAAFLVWGSALVGVSRALLARVPAPIGALLVAGLAFFASAVKMGDAAAASPGDFLRPLVALAGLALFVRAEPRVARRSGPFFFGLVVLAAAVSFVPLREGFEARRRELVELRALESGESPSNARHFLVETALDAFAANPELRRAMEDGPSLESANLAFISWAKSPLAGAPAGCHLRLLDAGGAAFSTFSLGFPPELLERASAPAAAPVGAIRFRREEVGSERVDVYSGGAVLERDGAPIGRIELALAYFDRLGQPRFTEDRFPSIFEIEESSEEFLRFARDVPDRVDRYRGEVLVASTDPEGGLGYRVPSVIVQALESVEGGGRWVERRIGGVLYDLYCVRERDGDETVGYLTFGLRRGGAWTVGSLFARSLLVSLVLAAALLALLMVTPWVDRGRAMRHGVPRFGFRERVIAGFLLVSLLPTVFLGVAGRGLFVQEKRRQFEVRLEEDLRVSRELLARTLSDAAANAAGSAEIRELLERGSPGARHAAPTSIDGLVVIDRDGGIRAVSEGAPAELVAVARGMHGAPMPAEFFRRFGGGLVACAVVPIPNDPHAGRDSRPPASVFAFQKIGAVLAAELERRVGSSVSFFADGVLTATSKPELYQSEVLSDLVESLAVQKVELEGARRAVLENRFGGSSFLSNYAPLSDERGRPVGLLATLAPFHGGGLDLDASLVLSRIYYLCLFVLAGALAAAVLLAHRLTRPILDLTIGAERIGAGELGYRIATRAAGEIDALVRSFNSMSTRLAESETRDRERREYIEAIIRHVASGVVSFDAEGRVATVNEAAGRILGADPAALVGRSAGDPALERDSAALLGASSALVRGEAEEVVREVELGGDEGDEIRSIRLVGTPLRDREGRPQGAVLVFEDLSDLIRSKKITAWAEMARQVAHEIKNPLTPMKLSAQHLQQAWKDQHPKFDRILRESTETIIDRCEALRRIAIEFADYARMPGRRIRTEDLGRLLREARRLYGDPQERRVRFEVEAPEGALFTRVDKDEVMRLFINLIENSIQAMPKGGSLAIRAWGENGHARVVVRDSGQGIPAENLGRIFEPSFSTKTGGAGLGLPICRAIMEDYGGSIAISSEMGQGTTVELVFPISGVADDSPAGV